MIGSTVSAAGVSDAKAILDLVRNADKYEAAIDQLNELSSLANGRMQAAEAKERDLASIARGIDERQALYVDRMTELQAGQEALAEAQSALAALRAKHTKDVSELAELRRADAAAAQADGARIAAELKAVAQSRAELADLASLARTEFEAAQADRAKAAELLAEAAAKLAAIRAAAASLG